MKPRPLDTILYWTFILGVLLGSVVFVSWSSVGFVLPKLVVFNVFLVAGMALLLAKKVNLSVLWNNWTGRAILAYFAVLVLYTLFSIAPFTSLLGANAQFQGLTTQLLYLGAFIFAVSYAKSPRTAFVGANAVVVTYGLLQYFGLDPFADAWDSEGFLGRTFSTLGNPNFFGAYLVLTLPFVVQVAGKSKWTWCLVVANFFALLTTASNAALLAAVVMGVTYFLGRRIRRISFKELLVLAVLVAVGTSVFQTRYATDFEWGRSLNSRAVIWVDTLKLIGERPWGYGLETMHLVYPMVQSPELYEFEKFTTYIDRAHNVILDLWVAAGPLAVFLYLFIVFRFFKAARSDEETFPAALAILGYGVTQLFGFETVVSGMLFWIIAGYVLVTTETSARRDWRKRSLGILVAIFVVLVILLPVHIQHFRADLDQSRALALFETDPLTSLEYFAQGLEKFPYDRVHLLSATERALYAREVLPLEDGSVTTLGEFIRENLDQLNRVTNGHDPSTLLLEAWFSALKGDLSSAEKFITEAKAIAPHHTNTYRTAAHIYEFLGDEESARAEYKMIRSLMPTYLKDATGDATRIFWKENDWLDPENVL